MTEEQLRAAIREVIEDVFNEVSTSASAGEYGTPFAFSGTGDPIDGKKKKPVPFDGNGPLIPEARSHYNEFKEDPSGNNVQKIGRSIAGITKSLLEMEKVLKLCIRLKNESKTNHSEMWKRTQNNVTKIEKKMVQVIQQLQELKK